MWGEWRPGFPARVEPGGQAAYVLQFRLAIPTEASRRAYPILKNDLFDFRYDLSVDSFSIHFSYFPRGVFSQGIQGRSPP